MNNNPFDSLRQLGQMGEQLQKMFGNDFMKNLNIPNMPLSNSSGISGMNSNSDAALPFQNQFNWLGGQYPRVDMYQTRNELIAILEIPGLERSSDVKVSVEPNRLIVRGTHTVSYSGVPKDQFLLSERQWGSFEREITLPVRVLAKKVRASYRKGLLEIHMIKDEGNNGQQNGNYIPINFE